MLGPERQVPVSSKRRLWLAGAVLAGTVWLNVAVASNPLASTRRLMAAPLWLAITLLPAFVVWNISSVRAAITQTALNGDAGSNDLLAGDVLRTHELQVWFLAEHLVDTPLVRA